jgi:myosin heavy subunit
MTDAAVAAPAETGAPIPDTAVGPGNALSSTGPTVDKPQAPVEADKPSGTVQEAIQRANAKVAAQNAEKEAAAKVEPKAKNEPAAKADAKVEAKPADVKPEAQPRGDNGKFAPKQADGTEPKPAVQSDSPHREAPSRYSNDAKAAWDSTPEPVKAETHRALREMEQGIQKYRADSEAYHEVREYSDLAKQQGTSLKAALQNYVGIEQQLRKDPLGGLEQIVSNLGMKTPDGRAMTLRDVAAHIMGQTPDEQSSRQSSTIQELRSELASLKQQVGGVTQTIQQQQQHQTLAQVQSFAQTHPRFDELSDAIQEEIKHGYSLEDAYSRAERLNPAAPGASSERPGTPAKAETPPLNPAGTKSITGAPSSGSNPVTPDNKPVPSIEDSLKRAFAKVRAA